MDKRLYLKGDKRRSFIGESYVKAAEHVLSKYYKGISVGPAVYKKMISLNNIIKTEEDQHNYISNLADDILETYPIYLASTNRKINKHRTKFVKYIIRCRIQDGIFEHIKNLTKIY